MKKYRKLIAACLALLFLLTACGESTLPEIPATELPQEDPSEPVTLRVLSNGTTSRHPDASAMGMDYELEKLAEQYQSEHENVTIEIEYLPEDPEVRANKVDQLRAEILAGNGPDVFLMGSFYSSYNGSYYRSEVEDLFPDVDQAMRNGIFCDIRTLYDADESLGKDALDTAVMDAGVVRGARYVLPLRYNFQMVLADREALDASGLNQKKMAESVTGLYGVLLEHDDPAWAGGALPSRLSETGRLSVFSQLIDYDKASVILKADDAETYVEQYTQLMKLQSPSWFGVEDLPIQVASGKLFLDAANADGVPLCVLDMFDILPVVGAAKLLGKELAMFPLRATDGSLNAYVTFWGAVSASCQRPRTAYDFLRQFLLEDSQWELRRSEGALYTSGWPVRSAGAVEAMWPGLRSRVSSRADLYGELYGEEEKVSLQAYGEIELTGAELAPMLEPVDTARFPIAEDFSFMGTLYAVEAENITAAHAAESLLDALQWHLDEG